MMKRADWLLRLHVLTIVVCASYITLGINDPSKARDLWWIYTGIVTGLTVVSLFVDRKAKR